MSDVTGGQPPPKVGGAAPGPEEAQVSVGQVGKAPDILRTEPLMSQASGPPSLVETGELTEEDGASQQAHQPPPPLASNFVALPLSVTSGPASMSPMVGGNEQHSGEQKT